MHEAMAAALDTVVEDIQRIQHEARALGNTVRPRWPMIVLKSPKGWTGPKLVDGVRIEGTFRAHQVPLSDPAAHPEHLKLLEDWLRSYRPEELFDELGRLNPELAELAPGGERRMGANPHANGGILLRDLIMPDFRKYAVVVPSPGCVEAADAHELGVFLRDVATLNREQRNFRIFGPDETLSNRLTAVFEVTNRQWNARTQDNDEFLAREGRVMEMLSEHQCEGWLEGYLLTGRQLHAFCLGPLLAQSRLCKCRDCGQVPGAAVVEHGCGRRALHKRDWHMGMGWSRSRDGTGRRDGLLWRCAHA